MRKMSGTASKYAENLGGIRVMKRTAMAQMAMAPPIRSTVCWALLIGLVLTKPEVRVFILARSAKHTR